MANMATEKLWLGNEANTQSCNTTPLRCSILLKNAGNMHVMAIISIVPLMNTERLTDELNNSFQFSFTGRVVVCITDILSFYFQPAKIQHKFNIKVALTKIPCC
jgi:hypothetical protein